MRIRNLFLLISLFPVVALATDPLPSPPEGVWTWKGQVGYVISQGNTEAESANAAIDTSLLSGSWKHAFHAGGLYSKNKGIVSAERWDTIWQSDFNFSPDMFTFGNLRYAHDMFSGFQYQAAVTAGLGYKFINSASTKLSAQLGAGFRQSRKEELIADTTVVGHYWREPAPDKNNDEVVTAGLDYLQQLTATTSISNKTLIESGSSNTLITDVFGLTVKLSDRLALGVGLNYQYNSKPPENTPPLKKVDTTETVNLVFSF